MSASAAIICKMATSRPSLTEQLKEVLARHLGAVQRARLSGTRGDLAEVTARISHVIARAAQALQAQAEDEEEEEEEVTQFPVWRPDAGR